MLRPNPAACGRRTGARTRNRPASRTGWPAMNPTSCRMPCQLIRSGAPAGAPGGKPAPASVTKIPATISPIPKPPTSRRAPGAAAAGTQHPPHADRAGHVQHAGHDEVGDLDPPQIPEAQQAERVAAQVETFAGERMEQATPLETAGRRRRRTPTAVWSAWLAPRGCSLL